MQSKPLENLRPEGERYDRHNQLVRNALSILQQVDTRDNALAEHILNAEQALRKACSYLNSK